MSGNATSQVGLSSRRSPLVQGEIIFDEKPLPFTKATISVRLEDTSFLDASAKVILEQQIGDIPDQAVQEGKITFSLYGEIPDKRATYIVRVSVDVDGDGTVGKGDYISMESYPVLTYGAPKRVDVRVRRVS